MLTGNDYEQIGHLKRLLTKGFEVMDLGRLKYFLGMEVARIKRDLCVSKDVCIRSSARNGMHGCKTPNTPMELVKKSGVEEGGHPTNKHRYQSLVGKLIYLTNTRVRPDIGFTVV